MYAVDRAEPHVQDEVFGSAYATAVYLSTVLKLPKDKKVYVIGQDGLEAELDEEGVQHIGGTVRRIASWPMPIADA
jgi:ribonucleotide monophosphatase NagD (HAD superfamily)